MREDFRALIFNDKFISRSRDPPDFQTGILPVVPSPNDISVPIERLSFCAAYHSFTSIASLWQHG